jgi:hypothetical protein
MKVHFYQDYTTYDNKVVDTYRYGISREEKNTQSFQKNNRSLGIK